MISNTTLFFIGNDNDVKAFTEKLSAKYSCEEALPYGGYDKGDFVIIISIVWIMIGLIICLLTCYDVAFQKKEHFIRITLGSSTGKLILNNILIDFTVLGLLFIIPMFVLSFFTNVFFFKKLTILMFSITLIINSLIYLSLFSIEPKKSLSNVWASSKLLVINYSVKTAISILTIIAISSSIVAITDCFAFYSQKDFFTEHSDYCYIYVADPEDDPMFLISHSTELYKISNNKLDLILLDATDSSDSKNIKLLANKNIYNYLCSNISGFSEFDLSGPAYIIAPESTNLTEQEIIFIQSSAFNYTDDLTETEKIVIPVLRYSEEAKLISINTNVANHSEYIENPVILYINDSNYGDDSSDEQDIFYFKSNNCMIKNDKAVLDKFSADTGVIYSVTNVLDYFNYRWATIKRTLFLNAFLLVLIVLLNIFLNATIIRFEYKVNAFQLAIKKIFGKSSFSRFKKLYLLSATIDLISTFAAMLIVKSCSLANPIFLLIAGLFTLIVEILIIFLYSQKYESKNLQEILKGGSF